MDQSPPRGKWAIPVAAVRWLIAGVDSCLFGPGYAISHAICRITVGYCLLNLLQANCTYAGWDSYISRFNPDTYNPVGILWLFGNTPPPAELFDWCQAIAHVTIWLVILGVFTRVSFVVLMVCMLLMTGMFWSFHAAWGHHQNVVLLAGLAIMFGRSSPLSVDGLI